MHSPVEMSEGSERDRAGRSQVTQVLAEDNRAPSGVQAKHQLLSGCHLALITA